jgi:hypothetical protein
MHLSTYSPLDPTALFLVLCDLGCKAVDSLHHVQTHFIDRSSLDMYSLPYGSPQRRINQYFSVPHRFRKESPEFAGVAPESAGLTGIHRTL